MDLAGKANDPAIQQLLVQLLNEKNYEVMEAHESEQGILMKAQATGQAMTDVATPFITEIEDGQKLAVTVPEDMDIDRPSDQSEGGSSAMKYPLRREPKQVQRMINQPEIQKRLHGSRKLSSEDLESSEEDYGDSGSEYSTDSENRYDSGVDSSSATDSDDPEKEGREVVAASNEYITDPNGDIRLLSRTTAEIRRTYSRLTKTEQEDFDQDTIALKQLLTMDPKKVYSIKDLETPDVLDRALRLLFRARFGQAQEYVRISPHIKYDKLSKETLKAIERNTKIQDEEVKRLRFLAAAAGNTTGAELPSDIVGNQEGGAGVGGGGSKGKVVKRSKGTGKAGGKKKRRRAD
ncbi:MAG: hypothetical protein L6R41_002206 [Letrouitia leprolyta]|nr:MAG: hypothetical protein L6R41_002206 [Letrouitia leprolyta]